MSALDPAPHHPPIVVDTDVLSYVFKGDTRAVLYQPRLIGHQPVISFMTVAELAFWSEEHNWGAEDPRTAASLPDALHSSLSNRDAVRSLGRCHGCCPEGGKTDWSRRRLGRCDRPLV
jgi:hypothetical protein